MNVYDRLLAVIPVSLIGGAAVGILGSVPLTAGLIGGGLFAGILMVVLLFVVPPGV